MKQFNFTYKLVSAYFLNSIFLKLSRKEFSSNELTAIGKEPLCVCYLKKNIIYICLFIISYQMSLKYKILNVVQFDDSGEMKRREGGGGVTYLLFYIKLYFCPIHTLFMKLQVNV